MQIVTVIYDLAKSTFHVIKVVGDESFNLHTIPVEAFTGWARQLDTSDPQLVVDAVLYAPELEAPTVEEVERVKALHAPETKLHMVQLQQACIKAGLPEHYHPSENPEAVLLEAARQGVQNYEAWKVQQSVVGVPGGSGGGDSVADGSESGWNDLAAGVADVPRPVPAGRRHRIVAGEQVDNRGHHRRSHPGRSREGGGHNDAS